jgi:HK97 family phage major capsid protein
MNAAQARIAADLDKLKNELRSTVDMACENDAETAARAEEIGKLTKAIEARSADLDTETAAAAAIAKVEARKLSVNSAGMVVAPKAVAPVAVRAVPEPSALISRAGFSSAEEMRAVGAALVKLYRREVSELRAAPAASTHPIGVNNTLEPDSMGEASPLYDGRGAELVMPLFYNAILNLIRYESVATKIARMLEVRGPKMQVQLGDDITEAQWYAENCEILPIKPGTAGKTVDLHKLGARVQVSNELMDDSLYSIVELVGRTFSNGFAKKLDKTYFQGDSAIGFTGLVPSIAAGQVVTAAAATPTLAEITSLMAKVDPMAGNRAWVVSDAGWAAVQGLATASIGTNITSVIEQRIFGAPVFVSHDLPAKTLALYGDFAMASAIGYHPNGLVIRSSYERAIEYDQWVAVATARYGFAVTGSKYVAALKTA